MENPWGAARGTGLHNFCYSIQSLLNPGQNRLLGTGVPFALNLLLTGMNRDRENLTQCCKGRTKGEPLRASSTLGSLTHAPPPVPVSAGPMIPCGCERAPGLSVLLLHHQDGLPHWLLPSVATPAHLPRPSALSGVGVCSWTCNSSAEERKPSHRGAYLVRPSLRACSARRFSWSKGPQDSCVDEQG